jgi:hypothetical protein
LTESKEMNTSQRLQTATGVGPLIVRRGLALLIVKETNIKQLPQTVRRTGLSMAKRVLVETNTNHNLPTSRGPTPPVENKGASRTREVVDNTIRVIEDAILLEG